MLLESPEVQSFASLQTIEIPPWLYSRSNGFNAEQSPCKDNPTPD